VDFLVRFASDKHSDDGEVASGHKGIGTTVVVLVVMIVVVMVMVMVVLVADVQGSKALDVVIGSGDLDSCSGRWE
jgi:predicted metalloprotease